MLSNSGHAENFTELAAHIVSAYVANNAVPAADLPDLIATVHQPNLVAQRHKNPSPVVSGRASLDADQARRQCSEESNDILTAQLAADDNHASAIDPVNLEHILATSSPIVITLSMDGSPSM